MKGCHCCGKPARVVRDNNAFAGQNYSDSYPAKVATQRHGFRVECINRCLMTCFWHYEKEAIDVWNDRVTTVNNHHPPEQ